MWLFGEKPTAKAANLVSGTYWTKTDRQRERGSLSKLGVLFIPARASTFEKALLFQFPSLEKENSSEKSGGFPWEYQRERPAKWAYLTSIRTSLLKA